MMVVQRNMCYVYHQPIVAKSNHMALWKSVFIGLDNGFLSIRQPIPSPVQWWLDVDYTYGTIVCVIWILI